MWKLHPLKKNGEYIGIIDYTQFLFAKLVPWINNIKLYNEETTMYKRHAGQIVKMNRLALKHWLKLKVKT